MDPLSNEAATLGFMYSNDQCVVRWIRMESLNVAHWPFQSGDAS